MVRFHGDNTGSKPVGDAKVLSATENPLKVLKNKELAATPNASPLNASPSGKNVHCSLCH
jgi:hypothetical protein